jgi:hypothetical protein
VPSLIESLIGGGSVQRPDEKRLVPTRRPLPARPRDLLELFVSLGREASIPALLQSCDLRQADPRHLTYVALSRWPTRLELTQLPTPYDPRLHLRQLLLGEEFRESLIWRICDAYPERQRLLYVRIPRCAGEHILALAGSMHAMFPPALVQFKRNDHATFIPALGSYLGRFNMARTTQVTSPTLAAFTQQPAVTDLDRALPWPGGTPPRRTGDRLFTIVREPSGLILSQVNAILAALQQRQAAGDAATAGWRSRLGALPRAEDKPGWVGVGRRVLADLTLSNPICTALGDGTAASALEACRVADVEIADLSRYADWITYTWNVEPGPATNAAPPVLTRQDLGPADLARLASLVTEDSAFYAVIAAGLAAMADTGLVLRGRAL